jgi:hypothetical protein
MRTITLTLSLLLGLVAMPAPARAAEAASVQAILINATKEKAPADRRLAPYEETLQRNLPESSFHLVSEGSASVVGPNGRATISLGGAHRIELEGGAKDAEGIHLKIQWLNGKTVVMNNSFTLRPGVPVVQLLRPSDDGKVPIVIVIAK